MELPSGSSIRSEEVEGTEKIMEQVCDCLCKYAATKGKTQQWLDKVCERCRLVEMITEVGNGGKKYADSKNSDG